MMIWRKCVAINGNPAEGLYEILENIKKIALSLVKQNKL